MLTLASGQAAAAEHLVATMLARQVMLEASAMPECALLRARDMPLPIAESHRGNPWRPSSMPRACHCQCQNRIKTFAGIGAAEF